MRDFEAHDVPQISQRVAADERRYRQYVTESLALENQKNEARTLLRDRIPRVEHRLSVLERAGTSHVELHDDMSRASVTHLAAAVDQQYNALSEKVLFETEKSIRKEQRARDGSRESMSFDR